MTRDDALDVSLLLTADAHGHVRRITTATFEETLETSAALTALESRAAALRDTLGIDQDREHREEPWTVSELAQQALERLTDDRDAGATSIDDFLPSDEITAIERRHGDVRLAARLDRYDIAAAVTAATIGTLIDFLVVKIPTGGAWKGEWQSGSPLTFALRSGAARHDNWVARLAPVPFDRVANVEIPGFGPRAHRVQTFGHDPLLGLVIGTMDIVRGTLTGADPAGLVYVYDTGNPIPNPGAALGLEVAHLLSDVVTRMGLPLPGWTALMAIPGGGTHRHDSTAELARWMYLRGYGTWHFLTMATMPAAIEATVRAYIGIRRLTDETYDNDWTHRAIAAGVDTITSHPRYLALSLLAHGLGAVGNAGRVAFAAGNPLAVNYAQWVTFIRRLLASLRPSSPAEELAGLADANRLALDVGWADLDIDLNGTESGASR